MQVGQATSRILGPEPCVAPEPQLLPCTWFDGDSAPQDGQREFPPVTSDMFPHLLQFRTDVPEPLFPLLPLVPLLPPLSLLPAFLSSSSYTFRPIRQLPFRTSHTLVTDETHDMFPHDTTLQFQVQMTAAHLPATSSPNLHGYAGRALCSHPWRWTISVSPQPADTMNLNVQIDERKHTGYHIQ